LRSIVSVRLLSGREEKFDVDFWGGSGAETRFKEFVNNPTIVLQLPGEVVVIPASAVESITFTTPDDTAEQIDIGNIRKAERVK
jgi:hypothetical protein